MTNRLWCDHLVKRYGKRTVVQGVSLEVQEGEIVGLLGPNGAGKTTTFHMLVGFIRPDAGRIYLNDRDITTEPMYRHARLGISYLPQETSVFRRLTVEQNILCILEYQPLSYREQKRKLDELIAELGLEKVRKSRADRLSGGERRRTEIARALAINPRFILLDEPFTGVDPIAVEDLQQIILRLVDERNIGILITDHNVQETLSIVDRAYLLFDGKILRQGTAEELASDPVVRRVYLGAHFSLRRVRKS